MLENKFRDHLLSHLSDHETEANIRIATKIAEKFALEFAIYLNDAQNKNELKFIKNCFEKFKKEYK